MSRLNQIQSALKSIDQAQFQVLGDAYLRKRGYSQVNPIGVMIGADKVRKGTPDTFVPLPNGRYLFAEHSTQQTGLVTKFKRDILKCLDEKKTGIRTGQIEKIILCHNSLLDTAEHNELRELAKDHGVDLEIFSIGELSYDLLEEYPDLAAEYLNIDVDTGQIVDKGRFTEMYHRNRVATRIDTPFLEREAELSAIIAGLKDREVVLVSGRPGVGKTRLVVESLHRFAAEHPEYEIRFIVNRDVSVFNDLRMHFSEPGRYLLVVDDANRFAANLGYIFELLREPSNGREFKILCTVRDYALESIESTAGRFAMPQIVNIPGFDDDGIRSLIKQVFPRLVPVAVRRIVQIAQGNARIAIMAGSLAMDSGLMESIHDVSSLYDIYFESITADVESANEPELFKAAAAITFLLNVDRTNEEQMVLLKDVFGIDRERFWELALQLYDLEVIDLYEQDIVRISDQVLGTYLFYRAAFIDRSIDIERIILRLFPRYRQRINDTIGAVTTAFDTKRIELILEPVFSKVWDELQRESKTDHLFELMESFWWLGETKVLRMLRDYIDALDVDDPDLSAFDWKPDGNVPRQTSLSVLSRLRYADQYETALGLLLRYGRKSPGHLKYVLHILVTDYGFDLQSEALEYRHERAMLDSVWKEWERSSHVRDARLFIAVVRELIGTHYTTTSFTRRNVVTLNNFSLRPTEALRSLRQEMFQRLLELHRLSELRETVEAVLLRYPQMGYLNNSKEIGAWDMEILLPYADARLEPARYMDCVIVKGLLSHCDRLNISYPPELKARFTNPTYELFEFLDIDRQERRNLGYEEYERVHREEIRDRYSMLSANDFVQLVEQIGEILEGPDASTREYYIRERFLDILEVLCDTNPELFATAFGSYLEAGNSLQVSSYRTVRHMMATLGPVQTREIIGRAAGKRKDEWLSAFFFNLPADQVTTENVEELVELYRSADAIVLPYRTDYLSAFSQRDPKILNRIVRTMFERLGDDVAFMRALSELFHIVGPADESLARLRSIDPVLLREVYLAAMSANDDFDYKGFGMNLILDRDPNFIRDYIRARCIAHRRNWWRDNRDYTFIWQRPDYAAVLAAALDEAYQCSRDDVSVGDMPVHLLTFSAAAAEKEPELQLKRTELLKAIITGRHGDGDFMQFLFESISEFSPSTRREMVEHLLKFNPDVDVFKKLPLTPLIRSSEGGSLVPVETRIKEFYESLLPLLNGAEFLDHRAHIEQLIAVCRNSIEVEMRSDFMDR